MTDTPKLTDRQLDALQEARRSRGLLYKSTNGYSATYAPPYFSHTTIKVLTAAGLMEPEPTAGSRGGARITDAGRAALRAANLPKAA